MTYSVYQHWDPLKVCVVGKSYGPEFYQFIENSRLRQLFEKIAIETEEDYQGIINTLQKFGVRVIRPNVPDVQADQYLTSGHRIPSPVSMVPRDQLIMIGERLFLFPYDIIALKASGHLWISRRNDIYQKIKGSDWPQEYTTFEDLPLWIQEECMSKYNHEFNPLESKKTIVDAAASFDWWEPIVNEVKNQGNKIIDNKTFTQLSAVAANGITRIGKDLYFGIDGHPQTVDDLKIIENNFLNDYRCHYITTDGHIDGCFTPIKPGLIVSIRDIDRYADTFPGWEVVYLEGESWSKVQPFLDLKQKNNGRWWIKGHEYDTELIDYVETWLSDWVGYCEESVFDVNILVVDEKNIIVSGYNEQAFEAFSRHGVTAHICPFRHRYFWDGGIHCVTLDLHREGTMKDYFPERGL